MRTRARVHTELAAGYVRHLVNRRKSGIDLACIGDLDPLLAAGGVAEFQRDGTRSDPAIRRLT